MKNYNHKSTSKSKSSKLRAGVIADRGQDIFTWSWEEDFPAGLWSYRGKWFILPKDGRSRAIEVSLPTAFSWYINHYLLETGHWGGNVEQGAEIEFMRAVKALLCERTVPKKTALAFLGHSSVQVHRDYGRMRSPQVCA